MQAMEKIIRYLKHSKNVFIASHVNPDGDAIGSLIAMGLALNALNIKTTLYNESRIPTVYCFLPWVGHIVPKLDIQNSASEYDAAIILDCGDLQRVGKMGSELEKSGSGFRLINIDHHITNTYFGDFQLVDISACATAEIVYRLIKKMGIPITSAIATCIYTGILTDTGSFRFSNTNKAAFEICNEMVALGVDPYNVAKHVYGRYSMGRLKLLNLALDTLEVSYNGKVSMMTITRDMFDETGTQSEDTDGLINYARRIEDVRIAVLIQECGLPDCQLPIADYRIPVRKQQSEIKKHPRSLGENRNFHVSLRSDGTVDVAAIAANFGGGGHRTAAGFNIESSMSDLKDGIFNLTKEIVN